jgi:rfaE bifunctional protein kinase chain/domain
MSAAPTTPERLLELVAGMRDQPVVMLVDLVADRFISGTPKRISREAPVLILRQEEDELVPGGGANAVANVAALGGRPLPVGMVGEDAAGAALLAALGARGIPTAGVLVRPGYVTPTKTRILAGGRHAIKQQVVRYDVEGDAALADGDRAELAARLSRLAGDARLAVLSDYGYGAVDPTLVGACRAAAPRWARAAPCSATAATASPRFTGSMAPPRPKRRRRACSGGRSGRSTPPAPAAGPRREPLCVHASTPGSC